MHSITAKLAAQLSIKGDTTKNLLRQHETNLFNIEQQLNAIIDAVSNQQSVKAIAETILALPGLPRNAVYWVDLIKREAEEAPDNYNSTMVLARVAKLNESMAKTNADILIWLASLGLV